MPHFRLRSLLSALATAALALLALAAPLAASPAPQPAVSPAAEEPVPPQWITPAERADFRATPSYADTLDFLRRLEAESPYVHLTRFGVSPQGRDMPLVVLSKERAFTPEAAWRLARQDGKPIVLIQNGIHSGEIDGKDASLMILRDVVLGRLPEVLDAATILIVPIYNVDGHERSSPFNRPNQDGPVEGMGFRTTAHGLDLNRDHLKVVSPEARAVIALFNRWRPHLHVDDHVTDGSDHGWVLTWSWAEAPQLHPAPAAWMEHHMPPVLESTEAAGHPAGPYISLLDRSDPAKGFVSSVAEPRYATGYYPLRNRPSILVEMHSYKPYRDRVLANRDFLVELLREVGRSGEELVTAVAAAEADTVEKGRAALGRTGGGDGELPPPPPAVLTWKAAGEEDGVLDRITVPFHAWYLEESVAMGVPILRYREDEMRPTEVPWLHRPLPVEAVSRPAGYLVLPGWPQAEERIAAHGLVAHRLTLPAQVAVEEIRVPSAGFTADPYQGTHRATEMVVERLPVRRTVPAGTIWIPADQPDFEVAIQLFEPEAPDSLFSWGLISTVVERKEYIEPRILEPMVREMLQDPAIRARWEAALEADPDLADDPRARWIWWYRQTPYWDDRVGLLPGLRAMERPDAPTEPWRPVASGPVTPAEPEPAGRDGGAAGNGTAGSTPASR